MKLLSDVKTLRQILEESGSLLTMFWRAALPESDEAHQVRAQFQKETTGLDHLPGSPRGPAPSHLRCMCGLTVSVLLFQDRSLREELAALRLKLSEREEALKDAMERVKSSNRTKDSMEHFIVSQRESLRLSVSVC